MCTYIKMFPHDIIIIALRAIVKLRTGSPKRLGMNKFVRTKSRTGTEVKFSKQLWACYAPE